MKAKLLTLFGLLAAGATGATTTQVINLPIVPDVGAVFRDDPSQDDKTLVVSGHSDNGSAAQPGLTNPAIGGDGANRSTNTNGGPSPAGSRDGGDLGTNLYSSAGSGSNGQQHLAPPAAPPSGSPTSGSGDAGSGDAGGLLPPDATLPPLGTLLQDPIGTLGGVVGDTAGLVDDTLGGVGETVESVIEPTDPLLDDFIPGEELDDAVDDTLDTLIPPAEEDGSGPVEDIIDDVDDTLGDVLPGEGEEDGGVLDLILEPGETPPAAGTPEPEATEPPGCVLIILC